MSVGYWGSKKRQATDIVDILCTHADGRRAYYEPFCGMASVGVEALRRECFPKMTWSDVNEDVIVYWTAVRDGWKPKNGEPITQELWDRFKSTKKSSPQRSFYGFDLGWGGNLLAGKTPTASMNTEGHLSRARKRVIEAGELLRKAGSKLRIEQKACDDLRPTPGSVIYCDPPYVAKGAINKNIDEDAMQHIWDCLAAWIRDDCIVYLSAATKPKVPPNLKLTTVRTWTILNRMQTATLGYPCTRKEYLYRVTLASSSPRAVPRRSPRSSSPRSSSPSGARRRSPPARSNRASPRRRASGSR